MKLPPADIYVCTGDMYPDFSAYPSKKKEISHFKRKSTWLQNKFAASCPSYRNILGSPDAPVVVVRGNHDFVFLSQLFGGKVYEIVDPKDVVEIDGLRFGGMRGIPLIEGAWSDEIHASDAYEQARKIPKGLDIFISHAPPLGIRDWGASGFSCGLNGIYEYIQRERYGTEDCNLALHLFGHVHEQFGLIRHGNANDVNVLFCNSATGYSVIVGEKNKSKNGRYTWNIKEIKKLAAEQ